MEQQTGSKLGKEYIKAVYCRLAYLTYMQSQFSSVQSPSHVWLFATPWTAAPQASLSITDSQSLLKFMSIESVIPSNHLILCHPLLLLHSIFSSIRVFPNELVLCVRWSGIPIFFRIFWNFTVYCDPHSHLILCCPLLLLPSIFPSIRVFPMSQFFVSGGQSFEASASASVLPMNIQNSFLLGLTGLISLQSKGLSRVFSNTTVQKHQFFGAQLSL